MKNIWKNISRYLPLIVGLFIVCYAVNAFAGFGDAVADTAGKFVAYSLGIDTADNCVPPQEHSGCLFCPMFKILYNAGNQVAAKAYSSFHSDLGSIVGLFLSVSLALIVLKNVASMNSQDPGTLVNDILNKTFVGIAIFIIVTQDYRNILNLTIVPIFSSGLEFVSVGSATNFTSCASAAGIRGFSGSIGASDGAGIPTEIGSTLICSAEYIESKINSLFEYGRWGFCRGMGPDRLFHIIPHPIYLIDALILYLGGIFFTVAYPWVLGDAILQLGIAMALLPFAVAGYAFKGTKQYLGTVFSWILNTLFVFMFMMILITCLLTYIENLIQTLADSSGDPKIFFTYPVRGIAFYGANMFMIIFVIAIGYTYMPKISDLAGQFAKGSALSAAKKFGTFLTDQLDKQAEKVGDKAMDIAKDATVTTGRVGARRIRAAGRQTMMAAVKTFGKIRNNNVSIKIPGMTYTVVKNADGSTYLKREITNPLNGRKHVMVSDKYATIYQEYDRNGNLIKDKVEFKYNFANKYLINKDGSLNIEAYKILLDSNLAKDPEFKKAIMAKVATEVAKARGLDIGEHFRSRTVTIDPDNPNKVIIVQIDQTGKKTRLSMDVNMITGQAAIQFDLSRGSNRFERSGKNEKLVSVFDNGMTRIERTGSRDPSSGTVINEKTKTSYYAAVQAGHASIKDNNEAAQVIDRYGNLASDINYDDFCFGMDSFVDSSPNINLGPIIRAATRKANAAAIAAGIPISPSDAQYNALLNSHIQKEKQDYTLKNIYAPARRRKTNRVTTNFGFI